MLAAKANLDNIELDFSPDSLFLLNICLAFIVFGIALDLRPSHFTTLIRKPLPTFAGLLSQLVLLPAMTVGVIWLVQPHPGLALGLLLVAVCPGGATSNYITYLAKGNVALSIGLTAIVTSLAFILTPLNFALWSMALPEMKFENASLTLDPIEVLQVTALILALPVTLGMLTLQYLPKVKDWIVRPIRFLSLIIFGGFIVIAMAKNWTVFLDYFDTVILLVLLHNTLALVIGYSVGTIFRLPPRDRRSITIETGIQNAGLGLVLIFQFFQGIGSMALIAGIWGVWHLISGAGLAYFWSKRNID